MKKAKSKNNNLELNREKTMKRNKALIIRAIEHIKSLNGIINYSTISQVTYDISEPLKKEKGISPSGITKNELYKSLIDKAKYYKVNYNNLESNKNSYSNKNNTIVDVRLQLLELRVKVSKLKMENKTLEKQLKTLNMNSNTVDTVNENIVEKYKYFSQICTNLISRLLELDIAYIDLNNTTLNVQMYDDVIMQRESFELLYKEKLNEFKNEK